MPTMSQPARGYFSGIRARAERLVIRIVHAFLRLAVLLLRERTNLVLPPDVLPRALVILDIGARGGVQWPWNELPGSLIRSILVEPDPAEAVDLAEKFGDQADVLPFGLWVDDRTMPLHINRSPGTSSVFPANRALIDQFPDSERFETIRTVSVGVRSIESLFLEGRLSDIDFVKLDVQGAELSILKGGERFLRENLVGLETEVEFAEMYQGQPLFAEVDEFVRRSLGLELWDLSKTHWKYRGGLETPGPIKGRLIFGDALYFRSPRKLPEWAASFTKQRAAEKLAMVIVCAMAYGYTDYAQAVLSEKGILEYWEPASRAKLQATLRAGSSGFRPFGHGNQLFDLFYALSSSLKPVHQGWASQQTALGSRRRGPFWL